MKYLHKYTILLLAVIISSSFKTDTRVRNLNDDVKTEFKKRIEKLNSFYSGLKTCSFDIRYNLYENYTTRAVYETMNGYYKKYDQSYHSSLLGIETIQNKHNKLIVDTLNRTIILDNASSFDLANISPVSIDDILSKIISIKSWKLGEADVFKLNFGHYGYGGYSALEIHINPNNSLNKLVLLFAQQQAFEQKSGAIKYQKPRVEINYTNFLTSRKINSDEFSTSKYITKSSNGYKLTQAYKSYAFFNQKN